MMCGHSFTPRHLNGGGGPILKLGFWGDYWTCLDKMKIYSLERRRERIIYVWKVLENMVPNKRKYCYFLPD